MTYILNCVVRDTCIRTEVLISP